MDVWLYRADGSCKILFPEIPAEYASTGFAFRKWYLDSEGNGYCWRNSFRTVHEDGHEKIYNTLLTKFSDSLLSPGKENTVFLSGYDPQDLLELFLKGSDTLWGTVSWEDMACDFSGELFTKILETAALYGDDGRRLNPSSIAEGRSFSNLFEFDSSEDMKRAGKTACGILFDDECHAGLSSSSTMAISSSSANKDGAWEFIRFLLGEEVQSSEPVYYIPLRKKNFDAWLDAQLAEVRDSGEKRIGYVVYKAGSNSVISAEEHVYTENDITEEKAAEYRLALQEARSCPLRTLPILAIIREEAADYFNGSKTAETVGQLITNRVQVYLSELP